LERLSLFEAFIDADEKAEAGNSPPGFKMLMDSRWSIIQVYSIYSFDDSFYGEFIAEARDMGLRANERVNVSGAIWQFKIEEIGSGAFVATAVDVTGNMLLLRRLLLTFIFVYIGTLTIIFWACNQFAHRAVAPLALAWERHTQFIEDASHELKTPLSVMYANYEVIRGNVSETVQQQSKWLDYMKTGMDRMSGLIKSMLDLARTDNGETKPSFAPMDVGEAIGDTVQALEPRAREKGLAVSCNLEENAILTNDKELFTRVFLIIYENALKYTTSGGTIEIFARMHKGQAVCTVKNTLERKAKPDLSRIFDRFYRADHSRANDLPGYGLGLPIAMRTAKALGGKIYAYYPDEGSIAFTFTLEDFAQEGARWARPKMKI
jgi:signal transduction histidine kinase